MSFLEVKHIEKHFGDTRVLEDINFTLEQGNALSIIGSSGSGKTTLLRCLNFLETPNQGQIILNGETLFDAGDPETRKKSEIRKKRLHFGLVFQSFNLFPQYTALKNVMLAKELLSKELPDYKVNRKKIHMEIEEQARQLLCRMGLEDRMMNYPQQLSGGQQQRVSIARALAMEPDILCFDEPTSALDPELTGEVLKVIRELKLANHTMIVVTHEMDFARHVSDQVVFMADGVIEEMGTPEQVFDHPQSPKAKAFLNKSLEEFGE
ncbi:MAG: amino acid ABC transporter ATP-binding protein [Clostridia bacterium]|nr:amino acid ABC transporter ATP-binding protein [Clostridia bacterium]